MHQWDGVWNDTLPRLEFLVSETRRANIMACGFHWDTIHIFGDFDVVSNQAVSSSGNTAAVGAD